MTLDPDTPQIYLYFSLLESSYRHVQRKKERSDGKTTKSSRQKCINPEKPIQNIYSSQDAEVTVFGLWESKQERHSPDQPPGFVAAVQGPKKGQT